MRMDIIPMKRPFIAINLTMPIIIGIIMPFPIIKIFIIVVAIFIPPFLPRSGKK